MPDQTYGRKITGVQDPPAFSYELATTDMTATRIALIPIPDNFYWVLDVEVIGYDSAAVKAHDRICVKAARTGGAGVTHTNGIIVSADTTGGTVTIVDATNDIEVKVQAANARNMKWICVIHSIVKVPKAV